MEVINVKHVIKLSTNVSMGCQVCGDRQEAEDIDTSINHYLQQHGAKLLHVGAESYRGEDGRTASQTVAMIGLDEVPPVRQPTPFNVQINLSGD